MSETGFTCVIFPKQLLVLCRFVYFTWMSISSHACLEQDPTETKVLRWDFHNFGLHYIHTYQNSWIWNQNQGEFWENANFSFKILKLPSSNSTPNSISTPSSLHLHSISTPSQFNSSKSWVGVMPYNWFAPPPTHHHHHHHITFPNYKTK